MNEQSMYCVWVRQHRSHCSGGRLRPSTVTSTHVRGAKLSWESSTGFLITLVPSIDEYGFHSLSAGFVPA